MFNFEVGQTIDGETFCNLYTFGIKYHVHFNQAFTLSIMENKPSRTNGYCIIDFKSADNTKCHLHRI